MANLATKMLLMSSFFNKPGLRLPLSFPLLPLEEVTTTGYDSTQPNLEHLLKQLDIEKNKMINNNLEFDHTLEKCFKDPMVVSEMQNKSVQTRKNVLSLSSLLRSTEQEVQRLILLQNDTDGYMHAQIADQATAELRNCRNELNSSLQTIQLEKEQQCTTGMYSIGCGEFDSKSSCYHLSMSSGSFHDLTKFCKKRNMQMVVLETWQEYNFIADIIKRGSTKQVYISLKWISGNFYWIYPNGNTVLLGYGEHSAWAPGEPMGGKKNSCVNFWRKKPGMWDDVDCSFNTRNPRYTICETMQYN